MSEQWIDLLRRDHELTERVFDAGEKLLSSSEEPDRALVGKLVVYLKGYVEACHNRKEEDHLFPLLATRGIPKQGGPLAVMLYEHEQSKALLAQLLERAQAYKSGVPNQLDGLRAAYHSYIKLLKEHFWKENDILYPAALRVLSPADAASIVEGIEHVEAALGPQTRQRYYELAEQLIATVELKDLSEGLDASTLAAILNTLPVELSFIDASDTVRYFSHEHQEKIFPRTRGAIGVKVQNCHPPKSLHLVEQVLEQLKSGKRQVAEFWIEHQGKKIHIRYWAVRDPQGAYLGCLETVQDITALQQLSGERRLLDDDTGA